MTFLSRADLKARGIPCSRKTTIRAEKEGRFPKCIKLRGRNAWVKEEIDAWQRARMAEREVPAP